MVLNSTSSRLLASSRVRKVIMFSYHFCDSPNVICHHTFLLARSSSEHLTTHAPLRLLNLLAQICIIAYAGRRAWCRKNIRILTCHKWWEVSKGKAPGRGDWGCAAWRDLLTSSAFEDDKTRGSLDPGPWKVWNKDMGSSWSSTEEHVWRTRKKDMARFSSPLPDLESRKDILARIFRFFARPRMI